MKYRLKKSAGQSGRAKVKLTVKPKHVVCFIAHIYSIHFFPLYPGTKYMNNIYAVIIQSLHFLCNKNLLTFANVQYRDGH